MSDDPRNIDAVIQAMYNQQVRTADKMNTDAAVDFWNGYNNSKTNWLQKGTKVSYASPRPLAKVLAKLEMPDPWVTISFGPELVIDPLPLDPWDVPTPQLPHGKEFIDIGADPDFYGAGVTDARQGDIKRHPENGLRYMFIQTGHPGTINYFLGWKLIGV